jgi:hypothetical protein
MIIQNRTAIRNILSNKRGAETLLNNVLGLIIAAIGIGLLIFGVVRLYEVYSDNEADNARNTLDTVIGKTEALKVDESNKFFVQGVQSLESKKEWWFLVGWGKDDFPKPDKCFFDSCVCYCKSGEKDKLEAILNGNDYGADSSGSRPIYDSNPPEYLKDACQGNGFCRKVDFEKVKVVTQWQNIHRDDVLGDKTTLEDLEYPAITLREALEEIIISINGDELEIAHSSLKKTYSGAVLTGGP